MVGYCQFRPDSVFNIFLRRLSSCPPHLFCLVYTFLLILFLMCVACRCLRRPDVLGAGNSQVLCKGHTSALLRTHLCSFAISDCRIHGHRMAAVPLRLTAIVLLIGKTQQVKWPEASFPTKDLLFLSEKETSSGRAFCSKLSS